MMGSDRCLAPPTEHYEGVFSLWLWLRSLFTSSTWFERQDIAARIYPARDGQTLWERDWEYSRMTAREKVLLHQWEMENPRPVLYRDWARHPETKYE